MIDIGDGQDAREHDVRRRLARMLADRLLAQRLRLVGEGEAVLGIALVGDRAKQLLGALDQARARRRGREHEREQKRADDETAKLHVPQYTPPIDPAPRRAV